MVTVRGKAEVQRYFRSVPDAIVKKVLPAAARAGGNVIAEEARDRVTSDEVRDAIVVRVRARDGRIVVKISVRLGWALSLGTWLEYGTSGHFITVDERQRQGMSVGRINALQRADSLVIGGRFVGRTVWHPGAQPHPFLRPAIDLKGGDAVRAMQGAITTRLKRHGLGSPSETEVEGQ
ncbi:HK97 gp10 family phage protein [Sphingomonas koreensis]|uniref:HK97 gp10 family phage protein n=1 Tax=Sphingomonas koreensis TaxID=93064 RepID=A0A1L6J7R5_9SPHN|nr:HK97 gp10 family phage protein [Sphingomonas koreensis]APR51992.1 hypothetical protein BRX40_05665 [Sphingomonas koreensis]RSU22794.1 HK97 gp10 family phage protein [Sphingomonas koreensis]RSU30732.1 HK97 gp10 family phage protein [Sphingomonas koreensis]RSU31827.1 HK97 gp10 family phage protein [Sphingomonas koreensis]RSU39252.1 HK97 gp10 family phage protein [Sphingomonas koreensis]